MAEPAKQTRIQEVQEDREALEHIARALEGRVLRGPGSGPFAEETNGLETLPWSPQSLKALIEAMPAAIAIVADGTLLYANAAFAYAFGYRSSAELREAGGLEAILPGGAAGLEREGNGERSGNVDALTRSRRRVKVAFAVSLLDAEEDFRLLRLIDQA